MIELLLIISLNISLHWRKTAKEFDRVRAGIGNSVIYPIFRPRTAVESLKNSCNGTSRWLAGFPYSCTLFRVCACRWHSSKCTIVFYMCILDYKRNMQYNMRTTSRYANTQRGHCYICMASCYVKLNIKSFFSIKQSSYKEK